MAKHIFISVCATLTLTLFTFFYSLLTGIHRSFVPPVILLFTWCCQPSCTFTMEPGQQFEAMLFYTQHSSHINEEELGGKLRWKVTRSFYPLSCDEYYLFVFFQCQWKPICVLQYLGCQITSRWKWHIDQIITCKLKSMICTEAAQRITKTLKIK